MILGYFAILSKIVDYCYVITCSDLLIQLWRKYLAEIVFIVKSFMVPVYEKMNQQFKQNWNNFMLHNSRRKQPTELADVGPKLPMFESKLPMFESSRS